MYHPRFKGNHYLMGQKLGNIFRNANVKFPIKLDKFQREFGKESGRLLKEYFPEAYEEVKGITDITGFDNELFLSWMMCMGCCLYNAFDEGVEIRGCTAFSFIHNGKIYHGRNNDLPLILKKVSKSIYYEPEKGYKFLLNTSSFVNGEEGINETGLLAAMTFVLPHLEQVKPGINSVFLVRYLLEKCSTVKEGIEALQNLPIASSCNIILTDKTGEMLVAECTPFGINIRQPRKNKAGEDYIITVNHFTSESMWKYDAGDRNVYLSATRYTTVENAMENIEYTDAIEYTKKNLAGDYGFMCQFDKKLDFTTIWSSIFDITEGKIYRAEGNPSRIKFSEDKRLKSQGKN